MTLIETSKLIYCLGGMFALGGALGAILTSCVDMYRRDRDL